MRTGLAVIALAAACGGGAVVPDGGMACSKSEAAQALAIVTASGGLDRCDDTCRRPGGIICTYGLGMDRCPADDGVNDCDCYASEGLWECTLVAPGPGSRVHFCQTAGDCSCTNGNARCVFDVDPRATQGRCDCYD